MTPHDLAAMLTEEMKTESREWMELRFYNLANNHADRAERLAFVQGKHWDIYDDKVVPWRDGFDEERWALWESGRPVEVVVDPYPELKDNYVRLHKCAKNWGQTYYYYHK